MEDGFKTPILLLVFNRPDVTRRVFEKIRSIKPKQLFIAADGARTDRRGEEKLCAETRAIVADVDWPCAVMTKYNEENLGCRRAVSDAINWFFGHVECGIILEDDCLPETSFFAFCETMLQHFAKEPRIMHISGDNFQRGIRRGDGDCYYSVYNHVWGWATWRRAWKLYDVAMKSYRPDETRRMLQGMSNSRNFLDYWSDVFERAANNKIDTWDYQWTHAMWMQRGLAVLPQRNLVSNIGFGIEATHTTGSSWLANLTTAPLQIKKIPSHIEPCFAADKLTARVVYGLTMNNLIYWFLILRTKLKLRSRLRRALGIQRLI